MGWGIALGIIAVLAILPLGVSVIYDRNGPLVRIVAGPAKLQVFPMKKKAGTEKTKKKEEKQPEKQPDTQVSDSQNEKSEQAAASAEQKPVPQTPEKKKKPPKDEDEQGGSILDFLPFVELALNFLGDFRRKLRINHLKLHLTMAGGDPANLAINYGRANASLAALLSQLDRLFVIKRRDVHINCDFVASETTILARLDITITLGRIISLLVRYAVRAVKTYLSIQKKRKGGANL